jgi:acyl-CoA hydrolase
MLSKIKMRYYYIIGILILFVIIFMNVTKTAKIEEQRKQQLHQEKESIAKMLAIQQEKKQRVVEQIEKDKKQSVKIFMETPMKELLKTCDSKRYNDEFSYSADRDGSVRSYFTGAVLYRNTCTSIFFLRAKELYSAGDYALSKEYFSKASCLALEHVTKRSIELSNAQLTQLEETCQKNKFEDLEYEQFLKEEKRKNVEKKFKVKLEEQIYQYQKDYINKN